MAEKVAIEDTFSVPVEERHRAYESTIVLSAKAGEDAREALLSTIRGVIADAGGELIEVSPAKEYTLAYPINKEQQGIMRTLVYRSTTDLPNTLTTELRHNTTLLRMLTIEQPKRPTAPARNFSPMPTEETSESASGGSGNMEEQIEGAIGNL